VAVLGVTDPELCALRVEEMVNSCPACLTDWDRHVLAGRTLLVFECQRCAPRHLMTVTYDRGYYFCTVPPAEVQASVRRRLP
jgi:hypothetical protein